MVLTIVIPVAGSATGVHRARRRRDRRSSLDHRSTVFTLSFLLDHLCQLACFRTSGACSRAIGTGNLGLLPGLAPGPQLVETKGARPEVSTFVETALVANDFARVESGTTPTGRFGGMAVEAPPTEILGLFRSGVVSVLDKKAGMWGEARQGMHSCRRRAAIRGLRGNNEALLLSFDIVAHRHRVGKRLVEMVKAISGHMHVWRAVHGKRLAVDGAWTGVVGAAVQRILATVHEGVRRIGKHLWPIVSNIREGCSPGHGDVVGVAHGWLNVVLVVGSLGEVGPVSSVILGVGRVLVVVVVDGVDIMGDVVVFRNIVLVELVEEGAARAGWLGVGGIGMGPHVGSLERMGLWDDCSVVAVVVEDGAVDGNVDLGFEVCVGGMEGGMHVGAGGGSARGGSVRVGVVVVVERVHGGYCASQRRAGF